MIVTSTSSMIGMFSSKLINIFSSKLINIFISSLINRFMIKGNKKVFICSTITPKLLIKYSSNPKNVTFGSMVYNLESIFGCGFQRGQPIKQNLVYLPVFLEAAKLCEKTNSKEQNEIKFMKKVLNLLDINFPESESEEEYTSIKKIFNDNLNNNPNHELIEKFNKDEIKLLSNTLKSMKHSCSPMIDMNKFYTNQICNFVRSEKSLAPDEKNINTVVREKIKKILESMNNIEAHRLPKEITEEIIKYLNGNLATDIDIGEEDPHRQNCLEILKKLKGKGVTDPEIDRNGLYAVFNLFEPSKRKLVEWLAKFVPYKQYENKEDLMHLANFLYCCENDIDRNFFAEDKEDFFSMQKNLEKFYKELSSDSGFKTTKNYTLIHDCEHGDANAVLLFRYLQDKNPQSKFKIIMQVSNKFYDTVLLDERMKLFYDVLEQDKSHDDYNIQFKICGSGNFENSLDEHSNKKLAFLDDNFINSLISNSMVVKN